MPKIQILPETVINQIAAGEVVERPASIVKELVENSLDAHARHITVKFSEGGTSYLSITDDGTGIPAEEVFLAFQRNSTSKLTKIQDLNSLNTFGFRGEALASIASVAQVSMKTKTAQESLGTEIVFDTGTCLTQKACSCIQGTSIEIRNVFEKIPARRLFLKSIATETSHIVRVLKAFILAEPDIEFEVFRDNKLLFESPKSLDLSERILQLYGNFEHFSSVNYQDDFFNISGVTFQAAFDTIAKPEFLIFIQKRQISSPLIYRTVNETFRMINAKNTAIGACLFINFSKPLVDFNVHPQKKEVRFKNENLIKVAVEKAILGAIQPTHFTEKLPQKPIIQSSVHFSAPTWTSEPHFSWEMKKISEQKYLPFSSSDTPSDKVKEENIPNLPTNWVFLGLCYQNQFALVETPEDLLLVHLANLEKYIAFKKMVEQQPIASQTLLIPKTVAVTPEQSTLVQSTIPTFQKLGIEIEPFGKNIYRIIGLPDFTDEDSITQLLQNIDEINPSQNLQAEIYAKWISSHLPHRNFSPEMALNLLKYCTQLNLLSQPDFNKKVFRPFSWKDLLRNFKL